MSPDYSERLRWEFACGIAIKFRVIGHILGITALLIEMKSMDFGIEPPICVDFSFYGGQRLAAILRADVGDYLQLALSSARDHRSEILIDMIAGATGRVGDRDNRDNTGCRN
jgi:hypothetical protein